MSKQSPIPESAIRHEPVGEEEAEGGTVRRSVVRITSRRIRLLDPDNLCPKYHIDALRYAGIIEDDTAKHIEVICRQEKVKTRKEEKTIIEVSDGV